MQRLMSLLPCEGRLPTRTHWKVTASTERAGASRGALFRLCSRSLVQDHQRALPMPPSTARRDGRLLSEASDIQKSINDSLDSRRFHHVTIEARLYQLEHWVFALLASRVDDLRERAAAMPDETMMGPGPNLADATQESPTPNGEAVDG